MPRHPAGPSSPNYGIRGARWRALRASILNGPGGNICHLCGKPGADEVDHVIPRVQRPDLAMTPSNLKPAHKTCNASKGDRPAGVTAAGKVDGWDVGPGNCPFAGVTVEAGSAGNDRPAITYTHPRDCGENHSLPW